MPPDPGVGQGHGEGQGQPVDPGVAAEAVAVVASPSLNPSHQSASPGLNRPLSPDLDQSRPLSPSPGPGLAPKVR